MLLYFKEHIYIPFLTFGWHVYDGTFRFQFINKTTVISQFVDLSFADRTGMYFDNLVSLGILERTNYVSVVQEQQIAE